MCSKFTCRGWQYQYAEDWCLVQVPCRRWATCRAPCRARIEAPALEPIPFLHFLKGSLICCCLTFNGKSLGLLRDGSSPGKGECREAGRVHHFGLLLLIHLLLIFATAFNLGCDCIVTVVPIGWRKKHPACHNTITIELLRPGPRVRESSSKFLFDSRH